MGPGGDRDRCYNFYTYSICHRGTALGMVIDDDYQEGVRMLVDAGAKLAMYGGETLLIPASS
jgi:hypothetical protein